MPVDDLTRSLLAEAWASLTAGATDPPELPPVELTGAGTADRDADAALPSRLPVLPAMTAAVVASTAAAAVLHAARTGRGPSPVVVDRDHLALAARSERYARQDGVEPSPSFAPLSRFWRSSDGWIRLHANYPWHRDRALAVLGCGTDDGAEPDLDDVAAAISTRSGEELEDAFAAAGALAFAVRTPAEWAAHPQGRAVAGLPLVRRTTRAADPAPGGRTAPAPDPPSPLGPEAPGPPSAHPSSPAAPEPHGPAAGIRVLDLTRVIAGPVATRTLAAWGADVLRIDAPQLPESAATALDTLPGKRSADLDLETPEGRAILEDLLAAADAVVHGYRPGALARFGLDAADLAVRHPHLVVVTLSAWGRVGPWGARRGFDSLVQGPTGIAAIEGDDGAPGAMPAQALDHATGYLAAAAALLGLAEVAAGGAAPAFELSLARTALWLTGPAGRRAGSGHAADEGTPPGGVASRDAAPAVGPPRTTPPNTASTARAADPSSFLVDLDGAGPPVHVVGPPGRLEDLRPSWAATTSLGADAPAFPPR